MPHHGPATFAFPSPAEALAALLGHIRPVETETITCYAAAGRILAAPAATDRQSPPADVSAMDGFAIRAADAALPRIPIAGEVRIGAPPPALPPGKALRIVTGSAIPPGAELVIPHEQVHESADGIAIDPAARARLAPGQHIRRAGENAPPGAAFAQPGDLVTPARSAALAAFGAVHLRAYRPLSIAILTTGDELTDIAAIPTPWQIRDSNGPALISLLTRCAWIADLRPVHVPDDPAALDRAVRGALSWADALLLTGGVSAGHRDYVPATLEQQGIATVFHRLPQRPGLPILGAVTPDGRPVLGLPGNPVSVMVTARRIAWPALAARAGRATPTLPAAVMLDNPDDRRIPLWWHRPARLTAPGRAAILPSKGSGDLISTAQSDGFVELPPDTAGPGPWPYYAWRP